MPIIAVDKSGNSHLNVIDNDECILPTTSINSNNIDII